MKLANPGKVHLPRGLLPKVTGVMHGLRWADHGEGLAWVGSGWEWVRGFSQASRPSSPTGRSPHHAQRRRAIKPGGRFNFAHPGQGRVG